MSIVVYRVQDATGRGPWRPGLSRLWLEETAPVGRLSESVFDLVTLEEIRAVRDRYHIGSACRSLDALWEWFTPLESARLAALGFHPVQMRADVVIAESRWQLVIGRDRPFTVGATRRSWCKWEIGTADADRNRPR